MKIQYIRVGDYYIPDLTLPEETRPIGKWGRMHREYLKEHKPIQSDVDRKTERTDAAELEALGHPVRTRRIGRHLGDDAGGVPEALRGILNNDLDLRVDVRRLFGEVGRRERQRTVQDRRVFAGEADDRERVGTVPRHFNIKDDLGLLELRNVTDERAGRGFRRILDDAVRTLADVEFLLGAAHAVGLNAAELALLDLELAFGDQRADLRERRLDALAHVRRTADDLILGRAVRHLADLEVIRIRMRLAFENLDDDNEIRERIAADRVDGLHLESRTRQLLRQFLRVDVIDLHIIIQPRQGQLHHSSPLQKSNSYRRASPPTAR